jgi:hypothetical protein
LWTFHALLFSLLATLLATLLALFQALTTEASHMALFLSFWSAALLAAHCLWRARVWGGVSAAPLRHALSLWLTPSTITAIIAVALLPQVALSERLSILFLLAIVAAVTGWLRRNSTWLKASLAMVVILLHGWPLLWVPLSRVALLAPWYALESSLLMWVLILVHLRMEQLRNGSQSLTVRTGADVIELCLTLFTKAWPLVGMLALGEWVLHGNCLLENLSSVGEAQWLAGRFDPAAAIITSIVLLCTALREARRSQKPAWVYTATALLFANGLYVRLLLAGLATPTVWDTSAVMGATYVLFIVQQFTRSKPLLHVVMVLPVLSLLTTPISLESTHASATFLGIGTIYLLVRSRTSQPLSLISALLAFNGAIYLWVPGWVRNTHMIQVCVMPVAASVMILLQVHGKELKPSVLNSARLTTMSILYACATVDVFMRGELAVFSLAIVLSLAGVVTGIALRTRAFLYSGVTFLVLNILYQLLLLYPEQLLGKAVMLLMLGVTITGGMIWFNLKREQVLQQIRVFRADLETWS